jgi:hypothetical protein
VAFSVKVAAVSLISCVIFSLLLILALLRCHDLAWSRVNEERLGKGQASSDEGKLNAFELLCILLRTAAALSSFLVGFVFLARIAFHF